MENEEFYYRGVFYKTLEELEDQSFKFMNSRISACSIAEIFSAVCDDIVINLDRIRKSKITNAQFSNITQQIIIEILQKLEALERGK